MKKLIIALAALMVSVAAYGQGQFVFNNRIGTEVNARFAMAGDPTGTSTIGSPDWTVQLLGGPAGTAVGSLVPLDPSSTTFRGAANTTTAGFVVGVTPAVPGVAIGQNATVVVRLVGPAGFTQDFGPYTVNALGGGTTTPPNLQLGTTPLTVVPEPTTLVLAALGLGGLLALRRRN
jgi:hypothetical protein